MSVDECEPCKIAVVGAVVLDLCTKVEGIDCMKLKESFIDGSISPQKLIKVVRAHTKDEALLTDLKTAERYLKKGKGRHGKNLHKPK
jgi:hypothetical protein